MEFTDYKMKDVYTGRLVRVGTPDELVEWLIQSYATLTKQQEEMVKSLAVCFKQGDEHGIKWYGAACGLEITGKTRRTKTK